MRTTRNQADEVEYDKELRRESPIKTEVIQELRQDYEKLLRNQARLLQNLLDAEAALRVYREDILRQTKLRLDNLGHCKSGCHRHTWSVEKGWELK